MNSHDDFTVLSCHGLGKSYRQGELTLSVLKNLDLEVRAGETIGITGSSGSGKTTLLNLLGGIDNPGQGSVRICGRDISQMSPREQDQVRNSTLGFVYQFHHLLGEFSALENVAMPLIIARRNFEDCLHKAEQLLIQVGLKDRLQHRPAQLSGGERQRVAIARALVNKPSCVLMDEPTGNLDRQTAASIHELMLALNRDLDTSFIIVTHDQHLAGRMDRVLLLEDGRLLSRDGNDD